MTKAGDRVRLISIEDQYTKRRPGSEGVVHSIDALGTVFVEWDDGGALGLLPDQDEWLVISHVSA